MHKIHNIMHLVRELISLLNIHICVPLVGRSVEKAPAGCILRCHHTLIQTTQHGHYIVLDGACNRKVLKKLGPVVKPHIIRIHCCVINKVVCEALCWVVFFKLSADLYLMYQKIVAQPKPVATLR